MAGEADPPDVLFAGVRADAVASAPADARDGPASDRPVADGPLSDGPASDGPAASGLDALLPVPAEQLLAAFGHGGAAGEVVESAVAAGGQALRVAFLGLGDGSPASLRRAGAEAGRRCRAGKTGVADLIGRTPAEVAAFCRGRAARRVPVQPAQSPGRGRRIRSRRPGRRCRRFAAARRSSRRTRRCPDAAGRGRGGVRGPGPAGRGDRRCRRAGQGSGERSVAGQEPAMAGRGGRPADGGPRGGGPDLVGRRAGHCRFRRHPRGGLGVGPPARADRAQLRPAGGAAAHRAGRQRASRSTAAACRSSRTTT